MAKITHTCKKIYDAISVSKYIIAYSWKHKHVVSNLKLQKMLYFLQAESLVTRNTPLFHDEIHAVDWGVRVDSVYREFNIFGSCGIPVSKEFKSSWKIFTDSDMEMIEAMVDNLSEYSDTQLLDIIRHQEPWILSYKISDDRISCERLKAFFEN